MTATPDNAAPDPQQIIAELQRKLDESRAELAARNSAYSERITYQAAANDVLKVMSASPDDPQPVFDLISIRARDICGAYGVTVCEFDGSLLHWRAATGISEDPAVREANKAAFPTPPARDMGAGRAILNRATVHIRDHEMEPGLRRFSNTVKSSVAVPLMRGGVPIGTLQMGSRERGGFSDIQVELLKTFADQAVIAIGSAETYRALQTRTTDLQESLQQQTATADVLKAISRSTFDLQTVLHTLVESAAKLTEADRATITRQRDGVFYRAESYGHSDERLKLLRTIPMVPERGSAGGQALLEGTVVHIPDIEADQEFTFSQFGDFRTVLAVPMLREGTPIGVIVLTRSEPRPFTDKQIELVTTFADQAVIAIENVRLFDEVQAKTRDLSEALTYQTASSSILGVIASSPTEVGPALQTIVESACKLCDAYDAAVVLRIGEDLHFSAHYGPIRALTGQSIAISRQWVTGRSVVDKVPVQVSDFQAPEAAEFPEGQRQSREQGHRCTLSVPLLREGEALGALVLRRVEPVAFSDKQIALLQTFADQAVIAIGNVRLFDEVQARTRDLSESLQQQTATADVLKVISASPGELEPVFQALLENAVHLCGAEFAILFLYGNDEFSAVGKWNLPPAYSEFLGKNTIRFDPKIPLGRAAIAKQPVQVADILVDQSYIERHPGIVAIAEGGGARTLLQVPMLKDNKLVGTIGIYRQEVRPFSDKQIALVQSFAAQAVIAIENTRLLNELKQRTADLSRSLEDLRAAQDRLVQTEKLASLGQLTAGIAHEIKNPLNFVNNFSALSAELTDELNDVLKPVALNHKVRGEVDELTGLLKDNLEKVVQHGKRADSIVKNMLLHSREGSREHRPADINSLLDESLNLAYHGARAEKGEFNIALQRAFDADAGTIELFPQEITRAFLNLIANGVYAATRRKTEDKEPGFEPTLRATTRNLGSAVEIRIRDNGTGIPAEVREKMFNPFFTTKPAGEGTGLGLSMTHDIIVKQHGGRIDVETEPGNFTEFIITLPRTTIMNKSAGGTT